MKHLPALSLTVMCLGLMGCPNPPAAKDTITSNPHPVRSTVGIVAKPSSTKVSVGGLGGENGGGSGDPIGATSAPTLKPASNDPNSAVPVLEHGQTGFTLGSETKNVWGQGPYLARPRMALAAGAVGSALIVAEGEHRPSLEVYNPDKSSDWALDTRQDVETPDGITTHDHGGGLMWMATGVFKNELWTAGGFDDQQGANGQTGINPLYIYRETEGFTRARKPDEGTRHLKLSTRACAGGVIDHFFYVAGGVYKDVKLKLPDGTTQKPAAMQEVQKIDLTSFDDATLVAPLPTGVASAASVIYQGHLYILGGYSYDASGSAVAVDTVQDFDPAANIWVKSGDAGATVPVLPAAMHSAAATVVGSTIYVVGGFGADGKVRSSFYRFNFNDPSKTWKEAPLMPTPRAMLALAPFKDGLWAIGGVGADGQALRTVEKFFMEIPTL
jgi:hypothetical protein